MLYHIFSWRRWRDRLSVVLAVAVTVAAFGMGAAAIHPSQAADAPAEQVCLPIIMYHSILEDPARQGMYVLSPAVLESDIVWLLGHGFTPVTVGDLIAYTDGGAPLPEKPVMLTFDDGYYNNYLYAFPLTVKYGVKAVLSPVVAWSERYSGDPTEQNHAIYSHATWEQLREMAESGLWEIGSHTYDMHENVKGKRKGCAIRKGESTVAYHAALRADLARGQELLGENVGVTPVTFAYPFGELCEEARAVIREVGFRASFTCTEKINVISRDPSCLFRMGRYLRPAGEDSGAYFSRIMAAREKTNAKIGAK